MTEESRAHMARLLIDQKYDDALSSLDDLVGENPPDAEARMYHLLVVRILMLRWNLSQAALEQLRDSPATSKEIIRMSGSAARVSENAQLVLRAFGRICLSTATMLAGLGTKRLIRVGAGSIFLITLATFQIQEDIKAAIPVHSKVIASTQTSDGTVSALDGKADSLYSFSRPNLRFVEAGQGTLFRVAYETKDSSRATPGLKPAPAGTAAAKYASRRKPSDGSAESHKGGRSEEPVVKADNGLKSPVKVLATYQSGRAVRIRKSPRFAAATVREIDSGVALNVVEFVGSWARVETEPAGTTGFVRKEFLLPARKEQ